MAAHKHLMASLVVAFTLLFGAFGLAQSAQADPYSNSYKCTVSTSSPSEGSTITAACAGNAGARTTASLDGHDIGAISASGSLQLPSGTCGRHTVVFTDSYGDRTTVPLDIACNASTSGGGTSTSGSGSGSGGTAFTGVAVAGIGGVGLLLLAGGALMLVAGRRRRTTA